MTDLALVIKDSCINVDFQNGDYVGDSGLQTAVMISVFSDQRVSFEELVDETDRKGYWGDMVPDVPGDRHGSKLWLLSRGKIQAQELPKIEGYVAQSLAWMTEDGVADSISVVASIITLGTGKAYSIEVSIVRPDDPRDSRFNIIWNEQEMRVA